MQPKASLTSISAPVPELPVADVERAQRHYHDAMGFDIAWLYPGSDIGAVNRGNIAIFFRRRSGAQGPEGSLVCLLYFSGAVIWMFKTRRRP